MDNEEGEWNHEKIEPAETQFVEELDLVPPVVSKPFVESEA